MKKIIFILLLLPTMVMAGNIEIEKVRLENRSENAHEVESPSKTAINADFNNSFLKAGESITYKITIKNNGSDDYVLSPTVDTSRTTCEVKYEGSIIKAGETKEILATYKSAEYDGYTFNEDVLVTIDAYKEGEKVDKKNEMMKYYIMGGVSLIIIVVSLNFLKKYPIPMLILLIGAIAFVAYQASDFLALIQEEKITINAKINYDYKPY